MNPVDRFQALIRHPDYRNDPIVSLGVKYDLWRYDLHAFCGQGGVVERSDKDWWVECWNYRQFCRV